MKSFITSHNKGYPLTGVSSVSLLWYFCHLNGVPGAQHWSCLHPQGHPRLSQHILLAHEDHEHEEPTEKVEAIGDPEEDLDLGGGLATGHVPVVAMEKIVEAREDPEDAKNRKQFAEEHLKKNNIIIIVLQV